MKTIQKKYMEIKLVKIWLDIHFREKFNSIKLNFRNIYAMQNLSEVRIYDQWQSSTDRSILLCLVN